jgi:hypothetical protein
MKYTAFHEQQFHELVKKALDSVQKILDVNRNPRITEDMDHQYDDKYALAEFLTNTTIAAQMNFMERMGLSEDKLRRLYNMVHVDKRSVTICFEAEDTCSFLKEQQMDVAKHGVEHVVETSKTTSGAMFGGSSSQKRENLKHKVIQKVSEYHWKIAAQYRIFCYARNDPDKDYVELLSRTSSTNIVTTGSKKAPFPQRTVHDPVKISLTWLLQNIKESDKQRFCSFKIDRAKESCRTPRRNEEIEASLTFFKDLSCWFIDVKKHFIMRIEGVILGTHNPANSIAQTNGSTKLNSISDSNLFCPVVPLMEPSHETPGSATRQEQPKSLLLLTSPTGDSSSPLLSLGDIDKLLNEQCRSLDDTMAMLTATFPSNTLMKLATIAEASLVLFSDGSASLFHQYQQCIEYIEEMLRKQLIAAIGKEVHLKDFQQFMEFHCQKIFAPQFAPKPFSYAIRRPNHYPDGILSIEGSANGDKVVPISTHSRFLAGKDAPPMYIPINAATSIKMTGDRILHGWINNCFASGDSGSYTLTARARQFSSFLLIVGVMAGADKFVPKDAIILQNKDEVLIPLLLNELPTAKEFKDAVASLSPEQQRFATAFRGMQLESSVFGVCVIQLKPQLEVLLGLPPDALTKEIRLTQGLMSLFVEYQIPSDLLSFDGSPDASAKDKVDCVKGHTKAVLDVIAEAKKAEFDEMEKLAKHHHNQVTSRQALQTSAGSFEQESGMPQAQQYASRFQRSGTCQRSSHQMSSRQMPSLEMSDFASYTHCDHMAQTVQRAARHQMPQPPRSRFMMAAPAASKPPNTAPSAKPSLQSQPLPDSHAPVSTPESGGGELNPGVLDFTTIPKQLDSMFEMHDKDSAIRATILEAGRPWKRQRQENLLSKAKTSSLRQDDCKSEMNKAFDLLDALSRSGTLPIAFAELHVIIAVTHCFENDVMGTVVQDNINPIEKVDKSILMVASTIQGQSAQHLIAEGSEFQRLTGLLPDMIENRDEHEG